MKKIILITIGVFAFAITSSSQIGVQVFNFRPTGDFGMVFKPAWSAELGLYPRFKEGSRIRVNFSATFIMLKSRMDVFPIYAVDGNGNLLPGEQSFQKYNVGELMAGMDVAIVKQKKFNLFAAVDIVAGAVTVIYSDKVQGLVDESYSGGGIMIGLRPRIGCEYFVTDKLCVFAHAARQMLIIAEPRTNSAANQYGLGVKFYFNK
jgi:hypothetical protein